MEVVSNGLAVLILYIISITLLFESNLMRWNAVGTIYFVTVIQANWAKNENHVLDTLDRLTIGNGHSNVNNLIICVRRFVK